MSNPEDKPDVRHTPKLRGKKYERAIEIRKRIGLQTNQHAKSSGNKKYKLTVSVQKRDGKYETLPSTKDDHLEKGFDNTLVMSHNVEELFTIAKRFFDQEKINGRRAMILIYN